MKYLIDVICGVTVIAMFLALLLIKIIPGKGICRLLINVLCIAIPFTKCYTEELMSPPSLYI